MIKATDFVRAYKRNLKVCCYVANKRFPDIPKDEWSAEILLHTEGTSQVRLFHNGTPRIELIYPLQKDGACGIMIGEDFELCGS